MPELRLLKRLLPFLAISLAANAHETDYFDLSLTELIEVEIYTASQEHEKASASPTITSVITAGQFQQWGATNLYEALSFLPGVELNESYIGYTVLTFRGVTPGLYNNKALFMINGQPVYESQFGSSNLEYIPIEMVERIEVVRSPASVLYGSNTVSGVVNVITRETGNQVSLTYGSYNQRYIAVNHHETNFSISASSLRDDGYAYGGTNDEQGFPINLDYNNAQDNIFIDYRPDNWRINASYFQTEKSKLGLSPNLIHHGDNRFDALHLSINHYQDIAEGTLNFWLRYDTNDKAMDAQTFAPNNNPITNINSVGRLSAEIQYKQVISHSSSYIIGANHEEYKSDPMLFIDQTDGSINPLSPYTESQKYHNSAIYAQYKYQYSNKLNTIVGLRTENNNDTGSSGLIPKLGMSYEFKPQNYLKFLYSEAFRAPVFLEKYIDLSGVVLGDRQLKSETIKTIEVGISSKLNTNNQLDITLYWLNLADEITRRPTGNNSETEYYNAPGRKIHGIEIEYKSILTPKSRIDINTSYKDGKEKIFNSAPFIANYTINIMYSYKITSNFNLSLSNQTIGTKDYILTDNSEGKISGYNLTNIILNYQKNNYETTLTLKNIFDEDYTFPEPVRRNIAELPGGPGASVYLNFIYHY